MSDPLNAASAPPRDNRGRLTSLPSALAKNIWRPGQSGNPGGKGGDFKACQALCREKSAAAAQRMFELARIDDKLIGPDGALPPLSDKDDPRIVMLASQWVYERAWGPPKPFDPKDEPDPNKPKFNPRLCTPKELEIIQFALQLMVRATRAPGDIETVVDQEGQTGASDG
jgi:hypothetical protein